MNKIDVERELYRAAEDLRQEINRVPVPTRQAARPRHNRRPALITAAIGVAVLALSLAAVALERWPGGFSVEPAGTPTTAELPPEPDTDGSGPTGTIVVDEQTEDQAGDGAAESGQPPSSAPDDNAESEGPSPRSENAESTDTSTGGETSSTTETTSASSTSASSTSATQRPGVDDPSPVLLTPTPGGVLDGSTVTFTWSLNGDSATQWWIRVGSRRGGSEYFDSGRITDPDTRSLEVTGLPTNGETVWIEFSNRRPGSNWNIQDFTVTAADGP